MSGWPSWAITEPSAYSTIEWTTLCGWTTTWICSGPAPNSQRASMTSNPLFIMVAESTEILRPMIQFACAHASSGVTRYSSARDHQRFLVREEKLLACPRGGERGAKPRRSNDGGHDAVDSGQRSHFDESCFPREYLATQTGSGEALVQPRRERGIRHAGVVGTVELAQLRQLIDLPIGGQCRHAKARRMPRDHIQSARSDRARRSEYRDVLNGGHLMNTITASGSMAMGASMRSSIPPWPGKNVPLSFTPAWRFIRDSNRSPIIPATASPSRTGRIHAGATLIGFPPKLAHAKA